MSPPIHFHCQEVSHQCIRYVSNVSYVGIKYAYWTWWCQSRPRSVLFICRFGSHRLNSPLVPKWRARLELLNATGDVLHLYPRHILEAHRDCAWPLQTAKRHFQFYRKWENILVVSVGLMDWTNGFAYPQILISIQLWRGRTSDRCLILIEAGGIPRRGREEQGSEKGWW